MVTMLLLLLLLLLMMMMLVMMAVIVNIAAKITMAMVTVSQILRY